MSIRADHTRSSRDEYSLAPMPSPIALSIAASMPSRVCGYVLMSCTPFHSVYVGLLSSLIIMRTVYHTG